MDSSIFGLHTSLSPLCRPYSYGVYNGVFDLDPFASLEKLQKCCRSHHIMPPDAFPHTTVDDLPVR